MVTALALVVGSMDTRGDAGNGSKDGATAMEEDVMLLPCSISPSRSATCCNGCELTNHSGAELFLANHRDLSAGE
jgi:hypothetical protein